MGTGTSLLLLGQVACAAVGLRALLTRVMPGIAQREAGGPPNPAPCVIADVWAPLAIIAPLVVSAGRIGTSVIGTGWAPIGAPACVGVVAVGAALIHRADPGQGAEGHTSPAETSAGPGRRLVAALVGAGLVALLLGGANELTIWTGQCAFAVAAVLLWLNTPTLATAAPGQRDSNPPGGLGLVLLGAIGQSIAVSLVPAGPWLAASVAIAVSYAFVAVAGTARVAGPPWAVRVGGWVAVLGTLMGIGALSVVHLMPQSLRVAIGLQNTVDSRVAHGFGAYAPEGMLLVLIPIAAIVLPRLDPYVRRGCGCVLVVLAVAITAWRIASFR